MLHENGMFEAGTPEPARRAQGWGRRFAGLALLLCAPLTAIAASGDESAMPALSERMMLLVIQLGVILFAARLGGRLFERLRLPGVLGELCIGIVI
jgi:hypothetical protein